MEAARRRPSRRWRGAEVLQHGAAWAPQPPQGAATIGAGATGATVAAPAGVTGAIGGVAMATPQVLQVLHGVQHVFRMRLRRGAVEQVAHGEQQVWAGAWQHDVVGQHGVEQHVVGQQFLWRWNRMPADALSVTANMPTLARTATARKRTDLNMQTSY